jgi:hypothetical protein
MLAHKTASAFRRPLLAGAALLFAAGAGGFSFAQEPLPAPTPASSALVPEPVPSEASAPTARPIRRGADSLELRILRLHAALRITPAEEGDWKKVAEVMRWNDAAMLRLVAERRAAEPDRTTALEDMKTYEAFNRAHLEGLKDLIASFSTLYASMPDSQKALADHVFRRFGRSGAHRAA